MHAIKVLREDHERISRLLEEPAGGQAGAQYGRARFERLERELVVHMLAEDNIFLPQVEDAIEDSKKATAEFFGEDAGVLDEASKLIAASYDNHREVRDLLEGARRGEGYEDLRDAVARHVETEERLFPKAEKVLEDEDFERIGDLIEHCKWQVRGMAQASLASSSGFRPVAGTRLQTS